jgi:2-polyprenyl-3-methyl-5-hydroxy-6-metoxy-1,4-benzoquinol methylase
MSFRQAKSEVGNLFDGVAHAEKYQSGNWLAQKLVNNFMKSILKAVQQAGSADVHEVGCGEGHILGILASNNFKVRGSDIRNESLEVARRESAKNYLNIPLENKSIYDLNPDNDAADTVLCCEVLEHLTEPEEGLKRLLSITRKDLIVSVPNEPVWHILNLVRGKYLTALGNTPGHYQHWSKKQFTEFVASHADIISVKTPLPWTLIHCRPRHKTNL